MEIADTHFHLWTAETHSWIVKMKDGGHPSGKFGNNLLGCTNISALHLQMQFSITCWRSSQMIVRDLMSLKECIFSVAMRVNHKMSKVINRAIPILVLVSAPYQQFLVVLESKKYLIQVPILLYKHVQPMKCFKIIKLNDVLYKCQFCIISHSKLSI